jgi:hypothetical protein
MDNWFRILNHKCEEFGRTQVCSDIDISKSTLSLVLAKKYPGNLERIAEKVQRAYETSSVTCPVLDDITIARCETERSRPFTSSNPIRVRLFRTCATCPHNRCKK